ncbi:MAG: transglutaminase-like domain-containing protein [Prevotella sp.]|nr:transglutaminase-like domain-containing protein [Prevotella sp.]
MKKKNNVFSLVERKIVLLLTATLLYGLPVALDGKNVSRSLLHQSEDAGLYLDFLYKYMPLPDKTDYSRAFYQKNVELSLQTRNEMPWGKKVPEREFKHFVIPVRVNNENLDNSREVFYYELKNRVKNLSMYDAILEVNHWCHEKVTYRPSDARTSSPLASVRTAYGRCGEESTLLVAALRSVGIPARQVYTPRWAHTDDNHAWVEAWADGKWYFLGACEPEPILNLGWFNESASRGMLMHTKVFGAYDGPEEVMMRTPCYTEINVIDNYAPTSHVTIKVVDTKGAPVKEATVEFKLYNYAEFYTVAQKQTNSEGMASLTAGKGDLLVWVEKNGRAMMKKVSFHQDQSVTFVMDGKGLPVSMDESIVPPPVSASLPMVSTEQRIANNIRLATEDSIRQAYEATMVDESRGNHATIKQFLAETKNMTMAKKLLEVISKKDLRDIPLEVLKDNEYAVTDTSDIYCRYVMNPRVENEWLTPYKHFFRQNMAQIKKPEELSAWCLQNIKIDREHNPQQLRMQPMSVYRERKTDPLGRNIFFVSVARSLGIPARINEVNGKLQYHENGNWVDVEWNDTAKETSRPQKDKARAVSAAPPQGRLVLNYQPTAYNDNPKYYIHFTLSKIEKGKAQLLTYPEEATWKNDFSKGVELDEGQYMLTTGTRMASGAVLAHTEKFHIMEGQTTVLPFTMREDKEDVQVIGLLNAENLYHDTASNITKSLLSTTGRGYYLIGIIAPNQEPTNHTLRDICAYRNDFEKWNRKIILLFETEDEATRFNHKEFDNLPSTVVWGTDVDGKILAEIKEQMKLKTSSLPIFLICDTFNRVVYVQQGYTINIGEQILKVIKKL